MFSKTTKLGFAVLTLFLASCDNPVIEFTTHSGRTFTIPDPAISYTRICNPGPIPQHTTADGLLIHNLELLPNSPLNKTISWSQIERIEFTGRVGELGGFCENHPHALNAKVQLRSGDRVPRDLTDTTSSGLFGVLKHGDAVIGTVQVALRDLSEIRVSFYKSWGPPKKIGAEICGWDRGSRPQVRVTKRTGDPVALAEAKTSLANPDSYQKLGAQRTLVHPFVHDKKDCGMLVLLGEAIVGIPWDLLRTVEFSSPDEKRVAGPISRPVHLTFADQRVEKAIVRGGSIEGMLQGGAYGPITRVQFNDVVRLEIVAGHK